MTGIMYSWMFLFITETELKEIYSIRYFWILLWMEVILIVFFFFFVNYVFIIFSVCNFEDFYVHWLSRFRRKRFRWVVKFGEWKVFFIKSKNFFYFYLFASRGFPVGYQTCWNFVFRVLSWGKRKRGVVL